MDPCGISIFSQHLRKALTRLGNKVLVTNLYTAKRSTRAPIEILHYVPSSFASPEASQALIDFFKSRREPRKLIVILHGLSTMEKIVFLMMPFAQTKRNTFV